MQLRKTHLAMALVSVLVALLLAACGGNATPAGGGSNTTGGGSAGSPEDAVRGYMTAAMTGEGDIASFLCTSNAAAAEAARQQSDTMRTTLAANGATLDVSGLTYTAQNVSGDSGEVVIAGKLKVSMSGVDQEIDFPEQTLLVRNEGGGWKVCGAQA